MSILKRSLVVAAIVGVGVVPSYAMADHKTNHNPPGQACEQQEDGTFSSDGGETSFATNGECASAVAKANKVSRNTPEAPPAT